MKETSLGHGRDGVGKAGVMIASLAGGSALPVAELAFGHDVPGVGKGRLPDPVYKVGVPTDVIEV